MQVRLDNSLELILERAPGAQDSRVLATVVATAGSTYRKPGARMMLMADGSYIGLLSGGCLESDLQIHAREVLESGVARAVEYDTRGPDDVLFGVGAGCEGHMRVLLEPAGRGTAAARALELAGAASQSGQATSLIMVVKMKESEAREPLQHLTNGHLADGRRSKQHDQGWGCVVRSVHMSEFYGIVTMP